MKFSYMFLLIALMTGNQALANADDNNKRYFFDGLEEVKQFSLLRANSWYPLDRKSLIVRTTPSKSYLLVLDREVIGLRSGTHVHITSNGPTVFAGFDRVRSTSTSGLKPSGRIIRIYKLEGKIQRDLVKNQIQQPESAGRTMSF